MEESENAGGGNFSGFHFFPEKRGWVANFSPEKACWGNSGSGKKERGKPV
jgi:hypothetical protein